MYSPSSLEFSLTLSVVLKGVDGSGILTALTFLCSKMVSGVEVGYIFSTDRPVFIIRQKDKKFHNDVLLE